MTNAEYFAEIAAALAAVTDGCAKYLQKNPNAKYVTPDGKERSMAFAIDVIRQHTKVMEDAAKEEGDQ